MSQTFFNDEAFGICVWSYQENDRIKASKIYKVAVQMEERYRKHHRIPNDCSRIIGSRSIEFARSESIAKLISLTN